MRRSRVVVGAALAVACGAEPGPSGDPAKATPDAGFDAPPDPIDAATATDGGADLDGGARDAADASPAGSFATAVVSFTPGACAGFGAGAMPGVVLGAPKGGGAVQGGLDVVSLGRGGEIVLSVTPDAIVDGPGVDFLVFENAFYAGGDPANVFAEPGEVSVSDDGVTWKTYPCTATTPPYGACAGWHPVLSSPSNGVSPVDPATAGGDPFDLADVGLVRARFVRIRDMTQQACPEGGAGPGNNGFDLDGIAVVHGTLR